MSKHSQNIPDFIEDIVNCLDFTPEVKAVSFDGTDTKYEVCCTGHMHPCSYVTINGTSYMVKDVVVDQYFTVTGDLTALIDPVIILSRPFYFHGTYTQTNAEVSRISHGNDKYPMIYLNEPISENFNCDDSSSIEREVSIRIFLMDITNYNDWKTDEHHLYAVTPMRHLAEDFVSKLKNSKLVYDDSVSYRLNSHVKIGEYVRDIPALKSLLNDKLSGVELTLNFSMYKDFSCYIC